MRLLKIFVVGLLVAVGCQVVDAFEAALVPAPKAMKTVAGKALRPGDISYIVAEGAKMPVLYGALDALPRKAGKGVGVKLELDSALRLPSPEAYTLTVNNRGAVVRAATDAGLFYGAVTLGRLIDEAAETGTSIPALSITDYPSLPVRAVHFDTKHHLDRSEYYYSLIDQLAQWKVNTVIWELEDKLRYERRPECSAPNALSKQEMRAICDYAKERHIDINPLVQGLGHAGFILKNHWELRENPESDWEFCPSDPRTYELQFDLYRDALEAMPHGKFLHVGGDEITAIGIDERCKATGKTPFELQMEWLDKVCNFAKEQGRTPIFWDDMPLKYGGMWWLMYGNKTDEEVDAAWNTDKLDQAIDLFPKDCIYMRWHYDDPVFYPHLKVLDWYKNKGLKVMAATAAADGGCPYMPRHGSKINDIRSFCQLAVDNNLNEGIMATCWDDGSPHWATVMRGFAALGEFSWNHDSRDAEAFKKAFERNYFGLYDGETALIEQLEDAASFFDGALVEKGRRNPSWQVRDYKLITLPDAAAPGQWSQKYSALLDSAARQLERCAELETQIADAKSLARRNRYTLDIYAVNNELFAFPAKLLKALERYDKATDGTAREEAKREIGNVCAEFERTKSNLIATYGKTRFMEQPNGYIADHNHHKHLAALTQDAQWLFLYENALIKQLEISN